MSKMFVSVCISLILRPAVIVPFASHRAMAAVFGTILKLPPLKQAMAGRQFKSVYLDHLLSRQSEKE